MICRLEIDDGEFVVLLGPVGLRQDDDAPLHCRASRPAASGHILFDGQDVTERTSAARPQRRDGLPVRLALSASAGRGQHRFPLRARGAPRAEIAEQLDWVARIFGLQTCSTVPGRPAAGRQAEGSAGARGRA